ncbi:MULTISPECIES: hypothetical protein [Staphylococcus]|uniref:Uncharacterized protein n=1 Tax=Staphylococcus lugdunensis TaxID=28035 RepID=A0ABX6BQ98_STALU|nr:MULTISPECIES: hypothetical protein [Staphylococcus]ADC86804.1 hypothetical protein SLGD_00656 [Staphylococcus lugdunensis HKU09-01]ARJ08540.1 hypothetical protein B7454_03790 [Staphylococcus lugdunensis]ARJ29011.1 hypothetical protein B6N84_03060 [Staphylococcus lugdunensis]EKS23614.1 hypothetical protein HMPREF9308_01298 [Staphylococcus lugdunensis ACS-027-V-Sch2]MCH8640569.1 hypothetical protein [Staphylococcus lugdunensis]
MIIVNSNKEERYFNFDYWIEQKFSYEDIDCLQEAASLNNKEKNLLDELNRFYATNILERWYSLKEATYIINNFEFIGYTKIDEPQTNFSIDYVKNISNKIINLTENDTRLSKPKKKKFLKFDQMSYVNMTMINRIIEHRQRKESKIKNIQTRRDVFNISYSDIRNYVNKNNLIINTNSLINYIKINNSNQIKAIDMSILFTNKLSLIKSEIRTCRKDIEDLNSNNNIPRHEKVEMTKSKYVELLLKIKNYEIPILKFNEILTLFSEYESNYRKHNFYYTQIIQKKSAYLLSLFDWSRPQIKNKLIDIEPVAKNDTKLDSIVDWIYQGKINTHGAKTLIIKELNEAKKIYLEKLLLYEYVQLHTQLKRIVSLQNFI